MLKISNYYNSFKRWYYSIVIKKRVNLSNISIVSMNCIGGVLYHDAHSRFLSPTVNLYFSATGFLRFVNNLEHYLSVTPVIYEGDHYPIGYIDDIEIRFMHYKSVSDAFEKWEKRKKRINIDKVFVIMVEQNGFTDECFDSFNRIIYPKLLFSRNKEHRGKDVVYLKEYKDLPELPNIIDNRKMYKSMILPKRIQKEFN